MLDNCTYRRKYYRHVVQCNWIKVCTEHDASGSLIFEPCEVYDLRYDFVLGVPRWLIDVLMFC
jgi:hypothetical protein